MINLKKTIFDFVFFKEPKKIENFILKESTHKDKDTPQKEDAENIPQKKTKNESILLKKTSTQSDKKDMYASEISKKLSDNLEYMKERYSIPINGDIILREFNVVVKDKAISAFIIFFDGMVDRKVINDDILQPLMLLSNLDIKSDDTGVAEYIRNHILPHNQLKELRQYGKIVDEINFGGCGIFIDGIDSAFTADVKGWEHRGVERPNTELVVRGPQEGFNEIVRVNTALIRKRLKSENLIAENIEIGKESKTPCSMMYIKDIVNDSLVDEVRRRLKSIKADFINDSGELEQFIEDSTYFPSPQMIATERPDKVAALLNEGKVAVVVHGSPYVLVMPATFIELIHSPEDSYVRFPYSNLLRSIRILAIFVSLLLPGLYLAITNFHQEMIPTSLILAIAASREKVPFPSTLEILLMEVSFELIREAGIRIPGPIGPTLGIVGALILGQAAVSANIVSPILIIIVAVTGIGSFAIPDFSLAYGLRILRFGFILLGAMAGLLGISLGLFILGLWLVSTESFGVPFFAPFAPKTSRGLTGGFMKAPIWKMEKRPDYMNTKDDIKQPPISREWTNQGSDDKNEK